MYKLVYRFHALQRMLQRSISEDEIAFIIQNHPTILEEYPQDLPYPSQLVLGQIGKKSLHIVLAINDAEKEFIIITVYEPDPTLWTHDFTKRRS